MRLSLNAHLTYVNAMIIVLLISGNIFTGIGTWLNLSNSAPNALNIIARGSNLDRIEEEEDDLRKSQFRREARDVLNKWGGRFILVGLALNLLALIIELFAI